MPPAKKRKSAADKKEEAEVTEAQSSEEQTEQEEAQSSEEQTDQEKFDAQQEEARQVQEGAEQDAQEPQAPKPYSPRHTPLQAAGFDQDAAEEERQAELAAQREEHNRRTGGVSQE